jgi:hypothetical protein
MGGTICSVADEGGKGKSLDPEILGPPTLVTGIVTPGGKRLVVGMGDGDLEDEDAPWPGDVPLKEPSGEIRWNCYRKISTISNESSR